MYNDDGKNDDGGGGIFERQRHREKKLFTNEKMKTLQKFGFSILHTMNQMRTN